MKEKVKDFFTKENIGILLGLVACLIFWFPYSYESRFLCFHKAHKLNLLPNLISGIIALVVMFILYARKIINYEKKSKTLLSFLVNLTLLATIVQIFINPANIDKIHRSDAWLGVSIGVIAAVIAIIIFGVQEFAKFAVLLGIMFLCLSNLSIVNEAMNFMGFVNVLVIFSSFYCQQNINLDGLKNDFYYLINKNHCETRN